jgi:hypothetical protein
MSQSTEVVPRGTTAQDVTSTRRIEAHAISAQSQMQLAAAMVEVYARTEGLPLQPIQYWFLSTTGTPTLNGTLNTTGRALSHEKRQWLRDWAEALGAEAKETRDYGSRIKLRALVVIQGVPVAIETDADHNCLCTGECGGDR